MLNSRRCGGDCSHETFRVAREERKVQPWTKLVRGWRFDCCKTAYKPYDLAVTCALVILKRYLGEDIAVASDGKDANWWDAGFFCQMHLGYGQEFHLVKAWNPAYQKQTEEGELLMPVPEKEVGT